MRESSGILPKECDLIISSEAKVQPSTKKTFHAKRPRLAPFETRLVPNLIMKLMPLLLAAQAVSAITVYCNHGTPGDGGCEKLGLWTYCCRLESREGVFDVPREFLGLSANPQQSAWCLGDGMVMCST
ncbi:hypothetical protein E4U42_005852 [Claviceps africana]|uniref:Uncharacterized protein n=1 Tax=Claviceps africana TaxID=83212 RepID=A0A8K0NH57_9HYPO|nr:hypothetical protein E4U42_005852 [Claviceps africana]